MTAVTNNGLSLRYIYQDGCYDFCKSNILPKWRAYVSIELYKEALKQTSDAFKYIPREYRQRVEQEMDVLNAVPDTNGIISTMKRIFRIKN